MRKNIWIFNHYASSMFFSKGGRHYWFAKFLKREGYEPVIFSCNAKHGALSNYIDTDALWTEKVAENIDVPFVFVKSSLYKGNGKDRLINMFRFYWNVQKAAKEYAKTHAKPDVIFASSVHPLTLVAGIKLAKYFRVKCICEIRDKWPLSLVEYGFLKENSFITKMLYKSELWIYKKADELIFLGGGFKEYIEERGWTRFIDSSKVTSIPNGIDLDEWKSNRDRFRFYDEDLMNNSIFKVVYTGSVRKVNNLGILLDVAKIVNNDIVFLVWGDGEEKDSLLKRIKDEHINGVIFKGKVEKKYIPFIVSNADLNIAHNNPSKLFRYGVSFNKIFDYLAAGKPILCDFESNYNPVIMMDAGIEVKEPNPKKIAEAIEKISVMGRSEYEKYCENAVKAAQRYDFANMTKELCRIIEK